MITDYRQNNMLPFTYGVLVDQIPANGSKPVNLQINQDAIFEMHNLMGVSSADNPNDPHPNNFALLIKDEGTGRDMMNRQISQAIICGASNESLREFRPIQFSPQTQLTITVYNKTGGIIDVEIALKGYKIFNI